MLLRGCLIVGGNYKTIIIVFRSPQIIDRPNASCSPPHPPPHPLQMKVIWQWDVTLVLYSLTYYLIAFLAALLALHRPLHDTPSLHYCNTSFRGWSHSFIHSFARSVFLLYSRIGSWRQMQAVSTTSYHRRHLCVIIRNAAVSVPEDGSGGRWPRKGSCRDWLNECAAIKYVDMQRSRSEWMQCQQIKIMDATSTQITNQPVSVVDLHLFNWDICDWSRYCN